MRVPAVLPIKDMSEGDRKQIQTFFRGLVSNKFVRQSMGQEASEECLERMFDEGFIKIAVEPGTDGKYYWRVLLYNQIIEAYCVVNHLNIIEHTKKET